MKPIIGALNEIRKVLVITKFFQTLLNSVIVFLVFFLVLRFFEISWLFAVIPMVVYFIYKLRRNFAMISLREVESKVPELREKLRTVADNVGRDDEIMQELSKEVMRDIRKVRSSQFIDPKQNVKKMVALGAIAFLILLVAAFNVDITGFDVMKKLNKFDENEYPTLENINKFENLGNDDIFGEESIVELGTEEVSLALNTMSGGLDLSDEKEVERLNFATTFQSSIEVQADKSYTGDDFSRENAEVVGSYFDKITGQGE